MKAQIIKCKQEGANWTFFCKYCKKKHNHGIGEGFRHPHCNFTNTDRYKHDYYLVLVDKPTKLKEKPKNV